MPSLSKHEGWLALDNSPFKRLKGEGLCAISPLCLPRALREDPRATSEAVRLDPVDARVRPEQVDLGVQLIVSRSPE